MKCSYCNYEMPQGAKFCPECGGKCEVESGMTSGFASEGVFMPEEAYNTNDIEFVPDPTIPQYECRRCNAKTYNTPNKPIVACEMCGSKDLRPITVQEMLGNSSSVLNRLRENSELYK